MAQFFIMLLVLFVLGCGLYGIGAGVRLLQGGFAAVFRGTADAPAPQPSARRSAQQTAAQNDMRAGTSAAITLEENAASTPAQRCLEDLKQLYQLQQLGAISEQEYQQFKQHLLATLAQGQA
jgi:hypothetical protein